MFFRDIDCATIDNTFGVRQTVDATGHPTGFISRLNLNEYCERAKGLAAEWYDSMYILGVSSNVTEIKTHPGAISFVGYRGNEAYILAGSLIRSIEDYEETAEYYDISSYNNKFNGKTLKLRKEIEKYTIKILIGDIEQAEYTMVLKDIPVKSLNEASIVTILSHNDARRRREVDLRPYKHGDSRFLLKVPLLNGFNLSVDGKCIGKINGSYVVTLDTHETKPIDSFLKYRDKISCGIFTFDFIYKEIIDDYSI